MYLRITFSFLFLFSSFSFSQPKEEKKMHFTGNAKVDLFSPKTFPVQENAITSGGKKSVVLASGLSLAFPGAGEYYTQEYWKAGIFLAAEITGITFGLVYNGKGNDQTNFFQNYADKNWSAARYADWTRTHAQQINSGVNPSSYNVFLYKW